MATMGSHKLRLSDVNEFIICPLCQGYLIDATTVNECLHTFCKSCIVKHIKNDHNDCPKCNTIIHERRPLDYIKQDRNKQDIVYKLVPQLYISELNRRSALHEDPCIDIVLVHRKSEAENIKPKQQIFLRCQTSVKVRQLRKLLIAKYQLQANDRVTLLYKGDIVSDEDQISNLAQSLNFCLEYEISRLCASPRRDDRQTPKIPANLSEESGYSEE